MYATLWIVAGWLVGWVRYLLSGLYSTLLLTTLLSMYVLVQTTLVPC